MLKAVRGVVVFSMVFSAMPTVHAKDLDAPKKRIAVTTFADKSEGDEYYHHVGSGMADMLTTALQKTGDLLSLSVRT